jgi:phosphodiesterase/alkaline phosphatase D-like protein
MNKHKFNNLNVITMLFLFGFILIPGVNLNIAGQSADSGSDAISYPMALPTVNTAAATGIGPFDATLNAFVNANNEDATVFFEYSTDPDFPIPETPPPDTIAATPSPVTGNGFTAISANLTGLSPGTVYFFRAVATNASGTTNGEILLFITDPPATVTTGVASPVTTTTATLNGIVNANNNSTTVTFEYGTTASYGTTVTADQSPVTGSVDTAVSKVITGLTPNTTYHFRVVGDNVLGTSNGEDMTFFTSAQTAPTVTTDDATFSSIPNQATLNGTVNANNSDATVTFEYGTTTAYGNTVTADQSPVLGSTDTAVSKLITGLISNTTYHYRVVATNGIGTTNGADMTFFNTTAPYAKTEPAAAITQTSATLIGTVNPKTFDSGPGSWTTVVTFEYGLTASYGTTVTAIESPIGGEINQGVSANLTGLAPNTTYHYRVIANNLNGTGTGADMTFTTSSLPVVTTNTAAPVGTTSATLNGTVNANGDSTTVTFEYGTTTSYGTTVTADQSPVTGTTDTAVSKGITGLVNGTTYHYRVVGTNSSGTSSGADRTFTTGVNPPTVSTNAAASITTTSAIMNGTVNANGLSTNVYFQWGFTTSYGITNSASPGVVAGTANTPVTFNPTTLLPNTTYHYRAVAQNAGGIVYGADMSFTTNAAPTVTTNAATSVTGTGATLNGTVNANNQSATVTFEYGTTTAYGTTVTADQSPVTGQVNTPVSKAITGLTPNVTYHYRVVGTNASGTANGADMTFTTTVGPPIVTTGSASPLAAGAILNGTVNAQNASTTVTFEYGTTLAYGSTATADQSPVTGSNNTAVTVTLSGLSFNTTYHYRVVGNNINGTANGADMTLITTLNLSSTTGAATNGLATSATVDYGTTIAYGSTMAATPNQVSGSTDTPVSAVLTGLTPNTTYHYRTTVYSGGFSYPGSDMTFTTPPGPAVTTNAATSVGSNTATVNGTVNANNSPTTVTFEYGFDTSYGQSVTAAQSPVTGNTNTAISSILGSLLPNTTYHYRVVGSSANGTVNGGDMTFTTGAPPPTVTTDAASGIGATGATLNGTVNPNNDSTTVTFEYGTTISYGTTVTADQSPVSGNSNTLVSKGITGLTANTTYHYRVVGQNGAGTSNGADMTFTTGTNTPTATTNAASGIGTTGATLNGLVNANGASTTVTFEYGTSTAYGKTAAADQSPVTGTSDTAVTSSISGLIGSTTYHYRVVAQNAFGTTTGADMTFLTSGSAPIATTGAATSVGPATATLNGTINAQNDSTKVTFEYGTTTSYGTTVAAAPGTVTGNIDTAVSNSLTGLTQGVTYHYRVVGQNAFGTTNGADMTFTTGLIIVPTVSTRIITNVTSSSAASGGNVTDEGMGTVTAKGVCWSTSPNPTIADNTTKNGSGLGTFSSSITGLSGNTTYYVRAYATNSAGTGYGIQRSFTTNANVVTITNPTAGEQVSGTVSIIATINSNPGAGDTFQTVSKVEFYIDDIIIGTVTTQPYETQWDTTTVQNGGHTIKALAYDSNDNTARDEISVTVSNGPGGPVEIILNRTNLNFGSIFQANSAADITMGGFVTTGPQTLLINYSGGGTLNWAVSKDAEWLSCSPGSGAGPGQVTVTVDASGLDIGTYSASIMVTDINTSNGKVLPVNLTVYKKNTTTGPFGHFATPIDNSTVTSSIPVTGWVLDDIEVTSVKIYRARVPGEGGNKMVYIGDAVFVDGARPDVEEAYPDYPLNYQAGWGYMMLTNFLPNQGNGTFTIYATATDKEGKTVTLGSKTIHCDNANAVKPFGAIDTPDQGGIASGNSYVNFGWALTPQPNTIPIDGSTMLVWVDGVPLGNPVYNQYRSDIADLFPGYNNSNGAGGHFYLDTTQYTNGVHTISWSAKDNAGNLDGIGSRYFTIVNVDSPNTLETKNVITGTANLETPIRLTSKFFRSLEAMGKNTRDFNPGMITGGINNLTIKELEYVALRVVENNQSVVRGYLEVNDSLRPLPIGSTLDTGNGIFFWHPGPGFLGQYHLVFVIESPTAKSYKQPVVITIEPK